MESSGSREDPAAGPCGHSYLYIGSVQHTECIDSLRNYQLVKALIIIIIRRTTTTTRTRRTRRRTRRKTTRRKEDTEKLSKYKDLKIAVSRMWTARTKIVPVTIGESGTIKKGSEQNRHLAPGHRSARELQKVTLMNTAYNW